MIEKAENNYSAYSPDLPGCIAKGATREVASGDWDPCPWTRRRGIPVARSHSSASYVAVQEWRVGSSDRRSLGKLNEAPWTPLRLSIESSSYPQNVRIFAIQGLKMVVYMESGKGYYPIKARNWLDWVKITQFSLIQHLTQTEPNAGDLNEREWILWVGVGCGYLPVGIFSIIRA